MRARPTQTAPLTSPPPTFSRRTRHVPPLDVLTRARSRHLAPASLCSNHARPLSSSECSKRARRSPAHLPLFLQRPEPGTLLRLEVLSFSAARALLKSSRGRERALRSHLPPPQIAHSLVECSNPLSSTASVLLLPFLSYRSGQSSCWSKQASHPSPLLLPFPFSLIFFLFWMCLLPGAFCLVLT